MVTMRKAELLAAVEAVDIGPSTEDLDTAPYMDHWRMELWGKELRLYGRCEDHPEIDDPDVTTSPILALDLGEGWARSYTRWYRIGPNHITDQEDEWEATLSETQRYLAALRFQLRSELTGADSG